LSKNHPKSYCAWHDGVAVRLAMLMDFVSTPLARRPAPCPAGARNAFGM